MSTYMSRTEMVQELRALRARVDGLTRQQAGGDLPDYLETVMRNIDLDIENQRLRHTLENLLDFAQALERHHSKGTGARRGGKVFEQVRAVLARETPSGGQHD